MLRPVGIMLSLHMSLYGQLELVKWPHHSKLRKCMQLFVSGSVRTFQQKLLLRHILSMEDQKNRTEEMDWVYPKRRGPEWKQSWTSQTLSTISSPPLQLLAIFAIVLFLLSLSQYTTYKSQLNNTRINFQLFLFLVPVLLIFFMRSSLVTNANGRSFNFWVRGPQLRRDVSDHRPPGASPWGVAVLVLLLLVLVSYQSSFHSKWFASDR